MHLLPAYALLQPPLPDMSTPALPVGDPFTRLLRPGRQTTAFQNTTEGQIIAVGLQLAEAPGGQLQVGLVLNGSPAQAAGVEVGDVLLETNGVSVQGRAKE